MVDPLGVIPWGPMRRLCLYSLCALLALGGTLRGVRADEGALAQRWAALRNETLGRLHHLAKWCAKAKLFGARAEVYRGVLAFSPDDAVARKRLKYKRDKDGAWVRKGKWKEPKNLSKAKPDFLVRRGEFGSWFANKVADLLDEAHSARAHRIRAQIIQGALGVDPEREQFRDWNDEVRDGKTAWILLETKSARKRRPAIRKRAVEAIKAVPQPEVGTPLKLDRHGGVAWQTVLEGKRVRVLGTTDAEEIEQLLRNMDACWPVFRYAFDRSAPTFRAQGRYVRAGWTTYVFDSMFAGNAFYAAQPGTAERDRTFTAPLVGTWIPKRTASVVKSPDDATRIEVASKQVVSSLSNRVLGLNRHRAWAAEGMALYLNYQIVGTRRIYSVNDVKTQYAEPNKPIPEYERKMADSSADWLDLGRLLLESEGKPNIHLMSGKDFNTLTRAETLYGYCAAAYIVEGWPEKAAEFFQTVGSKQGTDLDHVCLETLGFDARTFEARLYRWLKETGGM